MSKNIRYLAARFSFAKTAKSRPQAHSANVAMLPVLLLGGFLLSSFIWLALPSGVAQAENIVVNSLDPDVTCNGTKCTLPGAIHQTQINDTPSPTADTITFSVTGTISLVAMMDTMASNVTIIGPGADKLTVQRSYNGGTPNFGIFTMSTDATPINISISGLTIQNGKWLSNTLYVDGGAVYSYKATTLLDSVVITGNQAYKGGGGVKNEQGKMTIRNSLVANNIATGNFCREDGWGGGILAEAGPTIIDNVTVFNNIGNRGGGIYINGDNNVASHAVTVVNSTVISNIANTIVPGTPVPPGQSSLCKQASWGGGIGIGSGSNSFINSTLISGNVSYGGGGMFSENGTVVISGSAILSNTAIKGPPGCSQRNGGGGGYGKVSHGSNGPLILINTTVANNKAPDCAGGGLFVADEFVYLLNSTITANSAKNTGGGFVNSSGSAQLFLKNTILSGNTAASLPETDGDVISQGYNLIGNTTNGGWAGTDQLGQTNIALTPLQLNGGLLPNYALLDSRAINKGDPAGCTYYNGVANNLPLLVDQRGFPRPVGGRCDIGAVENQAFYLDLNGLTNPGLGYATGFVENSAPVALTDPAFLVHSDATSLTGATVKITNLQDAAKESLVVTTTNTAITADYNSASGLLTLSGTDTLANYKTVLQSVKYGNLSDNPGSTRSIEFVGTSDLGTGNLVTATVTITAENDAPVFSLAPQLTAKENLTSTVSGVSLTDPDANSGVLSVTLSVANGSLAFGNSSGLTFRNGVSSGPTLTFSGTLTSLNNALATLAYSPTQQYFSGQTNLSLAADDRGNTGGSAQTASQNAVLNVLSALFVTSNTDNGTLTAGGFGSLSYALNAANDPNRPSKVVTFSNSLTSITASPGVNYSVGNGVTLMGRCGSSGPEIELNGNGVTPSSGAGLTLNGGATISGLVIRNFNGAQLLAKVSGSNGKNTISCFRASRN